MLGEDEIILAVPFGGKEYVIGRNPKNSEGLAYMTAVIEYSDWGRVKVSDTFRHRDYLQLMSEFTDRIQTRTAELQAEQDGKPYALDCFTAKCCIPGSKTADYSGQVILIDPAALAPEYATVDNQLCLAKSGNGCKPDGHGTKVYATNIASGERYYHRRHEVLGIVRPECIPEWAREKLDEIKRQEQQRNHKEQQER